MPFADAVFYFPLDWRGPVRRGKADRIEVRRVQQAMPPAVEAQGAVGGPDGLTDLVGTVGDVGSQHPL